MESLYTVEELREQFGLEIFPDTSCLSGKNAQRRVCRKQDYADIFGIQVGKVLAMPPENPCSLLTATRPEPNSKGSTLQWTYRFETGLWQADIFLDATPLSPDGTPEAEPIYRYCDGLSGVESAILGAMEATPPWPQEHETFRRTYLAAIEKAGRRRSDSLRSSRDKLHQRYG